MRRVWSLILLVTLAACAEGPIEAPENDHAGDLTTMIGISGDPGPLASEPGLSAPDANPDIANLDENRSFLDLWAACNRLLTGIAYDGSYYYVAEGGLRNSCIGRFDGRTGELVDHKVFPPDFRGLHYTPATGLVSRSYGGHGGELYAIDYEAGTATPITSFNAVPFDAQSQPAVDPDGTTYWVRSGSDVTRRDLSDGTTVGGFGVVPLTSSVNGLAVTNDRVLVPNGTSVEIYDKSGTHLGSETMTASTFGCVGFGFGSSLSGDRIMYALDCRNARVELLVTLIVVDVDIRPGSDANRVNRRSRGMLPVAVLTDADFDAATVDPSTVVFGPADATPVRDGRMEDVDDDGDLDMQLLFPIQDTGLECDQTEATLSGLTTAGDEIEGTDAVQVMCRGNGSRGDRGKGRS